MPAQIDDRDAASSALGHPDAVRRSFRSQRLELSYLDWGNPDAPLLVLVHGGRDHAHNWDWVARELRNDWHVVCPDLRGHGDSSWSPDGNYTMPFFVADLAALVAQLDGSDVSIVAHSLGSAISLRYAGIFPQQVRRITAIEGVGTSLLDRQPEDSVAERWGAWIEARRIQGARAHKGYATLDEACTRMQAQHPHLTSDQALHLTKWGTRILGDGALWWKFDDLLLALPPVGISTAELHGLWRNIQCPVWLVHGENSWVGDPRTDGRANIFRNATVTGYENAGHWVHHNRFDSFVEDLKAFLGS